MGTKVWCHDPNTVICPGNIYFEPIGHSLYNILANVIVLTTILFALGMLTKPCNFDIKCQYNSERLFQPIPAYSSLGQSIPVHSSLFQRIPAYSGPSQPIPAHYSPSSSSSILILIHPHPFTSSSSSSTSSSFLSILSSWLIPKERLIDFDISKGQGIVSVRAQRNMKCLVNIQNKGRVYEDSFDKT